MSFATRVERLKREFGRVDEQDAIVAVLADFCNGGAPSFARVFDRRGQKISALDRAQDETVTAFRERARNDAHSLAGAARIVVGGIGAFGRAAKVGGLPRGAVTLPDIPLHASQREAVELIERARRVALVCGRRWGKSTVIVTLAVDYALTGRSVGIFAPTFRFMKPLIDAVMLALAPLPGLSPSTGRSAKSALRAAAQSTFGRSTSRVGRRAAESIISSWSTRARMTKDI